MAIINYGVNLGARYNTGKSRWSLLSVPALTGLIAVLEFGAKKYDSWNWSKGLSWTDTYDSLQRHLQAWMSGEDRDPETGLSHIAHVLCNAMFLLHFIVTRTGKDDRPLAQRVPEEEKQEQNDKRKYHPVDDYLSSLSPVTASGSTESTSGTRSERDSVVDSRLPDVQENVREKAFRTKFIYGDDSGEWWYLSDGGVGRYNHAGIRIV